MAPIDSLRPARQGRSAQRVSCRQLYQSPPISMRRWAGAIERAGDDAHLLPGGLVDDRSPTVSSPISDPEQVKTIAYAGLDEVSHYPPKPDTRT